MTDTVKMLTRALKHGRPDIEVSEARKAWKAFRVGEGWAAEAPPLLTAPTDNMKLGKDGKHQTWGLALAPSNASGFNVCRFATRECKAGCVAYAGNGFFPKIQEARQLKVRFLHAHPLHFVTLLEHEIRRLPKTTHVRLNTFSDIPWEWIAPWITERGNFYDYTKWPERESSSKYYLTYSASERTTDADILHTLERMNVAVIFDVGRTKALPKEYLGVKVVDGDKSDARWRDPQGVIVGLRAKGRLGARGELRKTLNLGMVRSVA